MPEHYEGDIEPIDIIESQNLDFHEGNIVKYICRWKEKDGIDDLRKAKWYIERMIENQSVPLPKIRPGELNLVYRSKWGFRGIAECPICGNEMKDIGGELRCIICEDIEECPECGGEMVPRSLDEKHWDCLNCDL